MSIPQPSSLNQKPRVGTSLVVRWLRLHASTVGSAGSVAGQGAKILYAAWCSQKEKGNNINKRPSVEWQCFPCMEGEAAPGSSCLGLACRNLPQASIKGTTGQLPCIRWEDPGRQKLAQNFHEGEHPQQFSSQFPRCFPISVFTEPYLLF